MGKIGGLTILGFSEENHPGGYSPIFFSSPAGYGPFDLTSPRANQNMFRYFQRADWPKIQIGINGNKQFKMRSYE